jgi:predicted DNA-binding protein (UPF0278 family)
MNKVMKIYMKIITMWIDNKISTDKLDHIIEKINNKYKTNYRKLGNVEFYI